MCVCVGFVFDYMCVWLYVFVNSRVVVSVNVCVCVCVCSCICVPGCSCVLFASLYISVISYFLLIVCVVVRSRI